MKFVEIMIEAAVPCGSVVPCDALVCKFTHDRHDICSEEEGKIPLVVGKAKLTVLQ